MDAQALHAALLRPDTYPSEKGPIRFIETHVSRLYITPDHVYKIKKPVDFGFLNFTTLDRRRFYCQEEVRLNDRFAPGIYLGVVDIRCSGGKFHFGGAGEAAEYAVLMNRLPEERMLDRLIAAGDETLPKEMDRVGSRIAALHRESAVCRDDGGKSNREIVRYNWRENFAQTRPFAGRTLDGHLLRHAAASVESFLSENESLLQEREERGWIREGHGDLHAEHVCLTEPVLIYDCIEFNRRFRVGDIAADIAFLLMDLEFRGRRDLAARLLEVYREEMGSVPELERLLPFYKLYRAWVRGKVESFLSDDPAAGVETRRGAAERARRYFALAAGYLSPQVMVMIGGLMGTGKTTLGRGVAELTGAELLRSDALRKELAGNVQTGAGAPFGSGIYTAELTRRTYDALLERTLSALKTGRSVVVDASFSRKEERERFFQGALAAGVPSLFFLTECDRDTALERLDRRQAEGIDLSDGRRELYDRQAAVFEIPGDEACRIGTCNVPGESVTEVLMKIIAVTGNR